MSFHVVRDCAPSPGFPAGLECASGSRPVIYTIIEFFKENSDIRNHQHRQQAWPLNGTKFAIVETTAPRLNGIWVSPDTTSRNKRLIKGCELCVRIHQKNNRADDRFLVIRTKSKVEARLVFLRTTYMESTRILFGTENRENGKERDKHSEKRNLDRAITSTLWWCGTLGSSHWKERTWWIPILTEKLI